MSCSNSPARRRNTDAIAIIALLLALGGALLLLARFRGDTADQATTALVTPTACPTPDLSTEVPIHNLSTTVPTEVGHIDPTPLPLPAATEARVLSPCDQAALAEAQRAYPYPPQEEQLPYPAPPSAWKPGQPCQMMAAVDMITMQPTEVAKRAQVIVRGTVTDISEPRWNTPDGTRPADPCDNEQPWNMIYRLVTVQISAYLKGSQAAQTIVIQTYGGTIGSDSMGVSPDTNIFTLGEEIVLFLRRDADENLDERPISYPLDHYVIANGRATNYFQEISEEELLNQIQSAQK